MRRSKRGDKAISFATYIEASTSHENGGEGSEGGLGGVYLIDNYDSFTFNISQYLAELGCSHTVVKNDELTAEEIKEYESISS